MICCDLEDNHNLMKLYKHKLKTWGIQMDGFHKEIHNKGIFLTTQRNTSEKTYNHDSATKMDVLVKWIIFFVFVGWLF